MAKIIKTAQLNSKVPIWEREEYQDPKYGPEDRNYFKSSYALDISDNERRVKSYGELKNICSIEEEEIYTIPQLKHITQEEFDIKSAHSRDRFKKKISCYFETKDLGRKGIYVGKRREEPIAPLTKREEREYESKYNDYIYNILLMCLYNPKEDGNDFYELITSRWNLYKVLGFANEKFFSNLREPYIDEEGNVMYRKKEMGYIESQFYKDAFSMFHETLQRALESLHRKKKINYYWETYVKKNGKWTIATRTETLWITLIEAEILKAFNCETFYQIILKGFGEDYKKEVLNRLQDRYNISDYKEEIDIWIIKDAVEFGIFKLQEQYELAQGLNIYNTTEEERNKLVKENASELNKVVKSYFYSIKDKGATKFSSYMSSQNKLPYFGQKPKEVIEYEKSLEALWEAKREYYIQEYIELKNSLSFIGKIISYKGSELKEEDMHHYEPQLD